MSETLDYPAHFDPIILPSSLPGPKFSREDLEILASEKISTRFGEWFKPLDHHEKLIRMPEPPLLLADRVTGIQGEPGSMGRGTIWTETDVLENAWYCHQGHMPAGIMIESGQADLLLISWLGLDFHNQGQRVYRLLGCELSYYGGLPKPGDTLCYEIHVDGHAQQGDIRLFFFHYDCRINGELRLKVRHGQAGFFSEKELRESGGVLWSAESEPCDSQLRMDAPQVNCQYKQFSQQQLIDFSKGEIFKCFGAGFENTLTHTRTPTISHDKMLFLHEITHFDLNGGPWQRGYMRAIQNIDPNDWFFKGHFKNDPCMPGTLMLEAGLQVMASYMTALGYTIHKDGWRFEPVPDQTYKLRCRGQVLPQSKQVVYEIFVSSIISDPIPMLFADLLGTVDGLKAFHTKIGIRLVPDWPLTPQHPLLKSHQETKPIPVINGFQFDYASLLACAWGKPSSAFGDLYKPFDNHRRVPRLPGPPYHFITRITQVNASLGSFISGGKIHFEYDVPEDAWYFKENSYPTMPFCVFLESTLQPCGWLASFLGCALKSDEDLLFRNLDGVGTLRSEILPRTGTLRTEVTCTNISKSAGMIIISFQVDCLDKTGIIYSMTTVFGFFPHDAFKNQVGIPPIAEEKNIFHQPSEFLIDLTQKPAHYFQEKCHLPKPMLLMLDRVTGFWPTGGQKNLGIMRAEKTVKAEDWFFKAHFFQDPVQPGSLGIEAMLQLLQFYMLHHNMHEGISNPRFEPLALDFPLTWKYRGQVTPANNIITTLIEVLECHQDSNHAYVIANASLWIDGKRIYEAKNMGMKIVSAD